MSRLIILLGPVASALAGAALGFAGDELVLNATYAILANFKQTLMGSAADESAAAKKDDGPSEEAAEGENTQAEAGGTVRRRKGKGEKAEKDKEGKKSGATEEKSDAGKKEGKKAAGESSIDKAKKTFFGLYNSTLFAMVRVAACMYLLKHYQAQKRAVEFYDYSHQLAKQMSHPQLMFKGKLQNGEEVLVDDYREAYWFLRDKTPEDSRVMAWWDYGYQITGIGNRTTIADGNTWNHEHIATLGRILSANEKRAHRIARHLADYVLVWAGGGGDDLAKSPHMARIGNSVFHDICSEPTCSEFGFYQGGVPTPMMKESLLYKMTQFGYNREVSLDPNRFSHAFTSKFGKCRVFKVEKVDQKSKAWVADPANRVCESPGSWLCRGQYPPALDSLIKKRKNFKQLEDFNKESDEQDKKYQEEYHKRLGKRHPLDKGPDGKEQPETDKTMAFEYVGCFGSESMLPKDKVYGGAGIGTSITAARAFAWKEGKTYVALARDDEQGHAFAFNALPKGDKLKDSGCDRVCVDADTFKCGCADGGCDTAGVGAADGETIKRRWVVYKVPEKPATKKTKKKDTKKKSTKK